MADSVPERNVGVLKTLTHLVDTVTSELVSANDRLRYSSMHDPLTGLYNRTFFEQEIRRHAGRDEAVGIIICDVDCLKVINDVFGHEFGDRILKLAAAAIARACRPGDVAARIGGDEFAVLAPGAEPGELATIAGDITAAAAAGRGWEGDFLHLSAGFAVRGPGETMGEAFANADAVMYRAKLGNSDEVHQRVYRSITALTGGSAEAADRLGEVGRLRRERLVEHEWAEASLRREVERSAALLAVSSRLNALSSYANVYGVICEECARVLNASAAYLHLGDGEGENFVLAACHGLPAEVVAAPSPAAFDSRGIAPAGGKGGAVSVRLVNERQFVGVLSYKPAAAAEELSQSKRALLSGLADLAAVHIAKARLWQKNSGQLEAITALYSSAQRLAHSLDMSNIAQDVCMTCVKSFGAPLAWVGRAEEDGTVTVIGAYPEIDNLYKIDVRWDETPVGQGTTGKAIRSGKPYIINDISKDPSYAPWRDMALRFGASSVAAFPLISQGKSFGALAVYGPHAGFFDEDRTYYLEAYGHQAAAALQNAALFFEAERRAARLQSLRDIDISITGNLDIRKTLGVVLDQAVARLGVDAADVFLVNGATGLLTCMAAKGFGTPAADQASVPWGREPVPGALQAFAIPALAERRDRLAAAEGLAHSRPVPLFSKGKLQGVLEIFRRAAFPRDREWEAFLDMLANQAAIAVDSAALFGDLKQSNAELRATYDATIEAWSRFLDLRDKETEGHSRRVTELTMRLAAELGMGEDELMHVRRGALLHDIGKLGIPDGILLKPGSLDDDEWVIMKKHPVYAYEMLSPIKHLIPALDIPYAHHEKWDGTGYPRGLKGEAIPLAARIFAVVDVWDALGADRPYRRAWAREDIVAHIRALRGSHFDPRVADLFLEMVGKK